MESWAGFEFCPFAGISHRNFAGLFPAPRFYVNRAPPLDGSGTAAKPPLPLALHGFQRERLWGRESKDILKVYEARGRKQGRQHRRCPEQAAMVRNPIAQRK